MRNWTDKKNQYIPLPYGNGRYIINKEGKIRWLKRRTYKLRTKGYTRVKQWTLIKPYVRKDKNSDKPCVKINHNGKPKQFLLVRLMLEVYLPCTPKNPDITYRDGNPENCAISNIKINRRYKKLSRGQVENIKRALLDGANGAALAKRYKVSRIMIHKIKHNINHANILPAPPNEE